MRKRRQVWLVVGTVVSALAICYFVVWRERYPKNEWHSRHDCRYHLGDIRAGLGIYARAHEGRMPTDFYELVSEAYLDGSDCICPAQYNSVRKAGFLADDYPIFVSSYRLLAPGSKFAEIPEGAVVLQEFAGNHPSAVVGGHNYQAGYHVIVKDGNDLRVDFIDTPQQGD